MRHFVAYAWKTDFCWVSSSETARDSSQFEVNAEYRRCAVSCLPGKAGPPQRSFIIRGTMGGRMDDDVDDVSKRVDCVEHKEGEEVMATGKAR